MKDTYPVNHWIKTHGDIALDFLRIYLGIGLIIKSVFFMQHPERLLQFMDKFTDSMSRAWFTPSFLAHYVILAHLCGGICLMLGLFTRTAALAQLPVLLSALFYIHLPQMVSSVEARESAEFAGLVSFLLLLFSIYGAGRLSVDYGWSKKGHPELFDSKPRVPNLI